MAGLDSSARQEQAAILESKGSVPHASMALALRAVRQFDHFPPESGACRHSVDASDIGTDGHRCDWGGDPVMDTSQSRIGAPSEPVSPRGQAVISRRMAIGGGLAGLGGLLLFPAKDTAKAGSFVVLLKGRYGPVARGPNLGLSSVNLDDGTYSTVDIYPVS